MLGIWGLTKKIKKLPTKCWHIHLTDDDYDKLFYKNALDIINESKIEKKGEQKNEGMEH